MSGSPKSTLRSVGHRRLSGWEASVDETLWRREASMQTSERELVARCRAGDIDAYSHVYACYERQVFRYAYHLLGHREDADDIKQETFLRAYKAIHGFRCEATLQTWLLKICGNLCRDRLRSWERRNVDYHAQEDMEVEQTALRDDPYQIVARSQTGELIFTALRNMPAPQREVIVLYDIEGLSYAEMAVVLDCSPVSIKMRVFRAHRALRERIGALQEPAE